MTQNTFNQIKILETIDVGGTLLSGKNMVSQQLLDTLYTQEEIYLLHAGVSFHEIQVLNTLFDKKYIVSEYQNIINRLRVYNYLLKSIETYDAKHKYKVFVPIHEPYNEQRRCHSEIFYPRNKIVNNEILIDLFSQGAVDLLSFKATNANLMSDGYLFTPRSILYVDLFNQDLSNIHERRIPVRKIKDDGLRFISLLPDNSVNYVISGLDDCIINSYLAWGRKYLDYLTRELLRTTKKHGIVAGMNFEMNHLLKNKGMVDIVGSTAGRFYCYEKK